ncbi:MAG: hypothetical protein QM760_22205 [Nibricoccus sp.]
MNKPSLLFLIFLALTLAAYEGALLQKTRARLTRADERCLAAQAQIDVLKKQLTETEVSPSSPGPVSDSSLAQTARTHLEQTRQLQQLFALLPEEQIPELRLLTNDEWLSLAIGRTVPLVTSDDYARTLSYARNKARRKFAAQYLRPALKKYLRATGDILPANPSALLPYFDPSIEATILTRYEMAGTGSTAGLDPKNNRVIVEKPSAVDTSADQLVEQSLNYTHFVRPPNYRQRSFKPEVLTELASATMAFRRDNAGQDAATFDQLRPYLKNPDAVARDLAETGATPHP